jgi:DDE family transposase
MEDRLWNIVCDIVPVDKLEVRQKYSAREILLVMLWAALHDRPIHWACQAENWPAVRQPAPLPHPSTVSRRRRKPGVEELLNRCHAKFLEFLTAAEARGGWAVIDGMPLTVSDFSKDPDARNGRAYRHWGRGYKLHAVFNSQGVVLRFDVCSLNVNERVAARRLLPGLERHVRRILADGNYDGKPLHQCLEGCHLKLYTPLINNYAGPKTHPRRRRLQRLMNKPIGAKLRKTRDQIERQFGLFGNLGFGFKGLPNWVRRQHRVASWMSLKVLLYHAYKLALTRGA